MKYELLYIVPSRYADTEIVDIQKKVDSLIEGAGGNVTKEENLGKIRLAYPVKQNRHGTYILTYFEAEAAAIQPFEAQLRLTDEVLRHMLLLAEKGAEESLHRIETYIAPLSEEDEASSSRLRPARPHIPAPAPIQRPVEAPVVREEKPLTIEELDKKLDKLLDEGDVIEGV